MKKIRFLSVGFAAWVVIGIGLYNAKDDENIAPAQSPVAAVKKGIPPAKSAEEKSHTAEAAQVALVVPTIQLEKTLENSPMDYEQLIALPVESVWEHWLMLLDKPQSDQVVATAALAQKLRQGEGETIYSEATGLLRGAALSASQHAQVVNLLGETSTPKALDVLAQMLLETSDNTLRYAIAEAIGQGTSGLSAWELKPHPELSPILESLWQQLDPDLHTASAIAARIAHEGAPSGVRLILEQIGQGGQTVEDIVGNNDPRSVAALDAMKEIRNPESLPLLQQTFQTQPLESALFVASGTALSSMGSVDATKTLLDWARQAPDAAAAQAQQWLGSAAGRDPDSFNFLKKELVKNDSFKSAYVKEGFLAVMNDGQSRSE